MNFGVLFDDILQRNSGHPADLLLNRLPVACGCLDKQGKLLATNNIWDSQFGLKSDFEAILSTNQPCGTPTRGLLCKHVQKALETGLCHFELTINKPCGDLSFWDITLQQETETSDLVFACAHEISRHKINLEKITEKEQVKSAIAKEREAHELMRIVVDSAPFVINLWDKSANLLQTSQQAVVLHNVSSKREYIERFFDLSPTHQPCGTPSSELAPYYLNKAYQEGYVQFEWLHSTLYGKPIPTEITLVRFERHGEYMLVGYTTDLSLAKAAMQREHESNELNEIFRKSSPFIMNVWDEDYNFVSTSQQAVQMFGLESQEQYIKQFFELSPEFQPCGTSSREKAIDYVKAAFDTDGKIVFEWMHQTLTGEPLPSEITLFRFSRQGKYFVAAFTVDLRPVKAAMEATHERELNQRIRSFFNASPVGISIYDEHLSFIDCNMSNVTMFGFSDKNDLIKEFTKPFPVLSPEFQPCGTRSTDKAQLLLGEVISNRYAQFEWMHNDANGNELPTETTIVLVSYKDTFELVAYVRDLREIKASLAKENEAISRQAQIYNASPIPSSLWNSDFMPMDCNRAMVELLEMPTKDDFVYKFAEYNPVMQSGGLSTVEKVAWIAHEVLEHGICRCDWLFKTASGEIIPGESIAVRIDLSDSQLISVYFQDMRQINAAMEKERIAEVAEESSRAKSRFLARMSHEIRTPITAVLGISEIQLQNANLSPQLVEAFAKIHNSSNILLDIINDILDLSKIEADKMTIIEEEYNTASLISDVAHLHFSYIDSKDIIFHLNVDENLPSSLIGDALRIKQIVSNLLSNAFKYTESGVVELNFYLQQKKSTTSHSKRNSNNNRNKNADKLCPAKRNGFKNNTPICEDFCNFDFPISEKNDCIGLVISVRDTGFGMNLEQLDALYSEYTRFHEEEKRFIGGTGLGMPIVYSLIKMMDAHIEIKSESGMGTCVTVGIPQKLVNDDVLGKDMVSSLRYFEVSALSSAKRFNFEPEPMPYGSVLVVDDVEANLYVIQGLLAFYELNIESCVNGYEAINKIKQGKMYDIVFMDHMMPGLNGIETMQIMRDMGYTQPIVALTANAIIGQAEEFIKNGFDGFISKPIQTLRLNTILVKHIKDKQPPEVIKAAISAKRKTPNLGNVKIEDFQKDANLIAKLRLEYAKNHKNMIAEIQEAIKTGNLSVAHRLAHTLKGLGGLMHEPKLTELAAQVEYLLKDEKLPINELLSKLEQEHHRVLKSVGTSETGVCVNNKVLDREKAKEIFDQLTPLLESHNAECLTLLDNLKTIPETAALVKLIDDFEFETAVKLIKALRTILEV